MVAFLKTTFVVFIIIFFLKTTSGETDIFSCLHLKSLCRRIPECRIHLRHLESKCGISLQRCETSQISDCVHCLRSIRETLGVYNGTCWCYEDLGAIRECEHFRTKIWSHPCEKRISDFGIQNKLFQLAAEDPQPIRNTLLLTEEYPDDIDVFEKSSVVKRTTRSPMATEIEQWRHQLSGVLPGLRSFKTDLSCNSALYDVCLKHISCRELWKIFRESCVVDAQNQCRMTNKDNCWQSFEGISWTGLGNCTCVDRNSDCHWIRLQTNYNKCIYELSLSGYTSQNQNSPSTYIQQYQHHINKLQGNLPRYEPTVGIPTTQRTTTTTTVATTNTAYPLTAPDNHEHIRRTQEWERRNQERLRLDREREEKLRQERQKLAEERLKLEEEKQKLERQKVEDENRRRIYEEARKAEEYRRRVMEMQYNNSQSPRTRNEILVRNNQHLRNQQNTRTPPFTGHIRADLRTQNRLSSTSETVTTTLEKPPTNYYRYSSSHRPNTTRTRQRITTTRSPTTSTTTTITPTTPEEPPIVTLATSEDLSTSREVTVTSSTSRPFKGAPVNSPTHLELRSEIKHGGSTCQKAHKRCELNETCKWHLSEVHMRCNSESSCIRYQCASALRRFSRYVNKELAEAVTFCQCLPGDAQCKEHQHLMYPRCMYSHPEKSPKDNCLESIKLCKKEGHCNRHLSSFNKSCSITEGGICSSENLGKCRQAMMSIRGTPLEMPCYCPEDDAVCLFEQSLMLPSNPCVELAMEDYSKSHPDNYSQPPEKVETDLSINEPSEELKNDIQSLSSSSTTASTEPSSEVTLAPSVSTSTESRETDKKIEDILMQKKKVKVEKMNPDDIIQAINSTQSPSGDVESSDTTTGIKATTTTPYRRKNLHTYPTDAYVTQVPPPQGGCVARNIDGSWITHYKNSIVRQYNDWSGRCSSWCECSSDEKLTCHELPCLEDVGCRTDQTQLAFGEKLYVNERGACTCHSGEFVCDTTSDFPDEMDAGLYISVGFSSRELKMFRESVPKNIKERSGLISPESSVVKDIVSRLQFALERVMPKDTLCRIIIVDELTHDENAVLQLQWYGLDPYTNITEPQWHVGKMEKTCAPYVKQLQYTFLLEKADRYQLLLSAVKQLTVFDLLDGLPPLNKAYIHSFSNVVLIGLSLLGFTRRNDFFLY